ncbi:TonB-dependent receptor [Brevundimonas sp.]|jgi:iron complex outermembrane recepter protein|uniref:TonB-dependent receptor n=1 Tax=Brevundimonas sp. TaxID=1871086 RepID=UPI0017B9AB29|nr:TonB-dependent receptor [Brevundimonas sp.]MBA4807978.1 TonB-dependent receptor [Brevundimonas sp.]
MKRLLLGASGAVLALAAMPASAQTHSETRASTLQDIVVTAQRREQSSQDVGIALSVVDGGDLNEKGVNVINDIENVVPNLEVDSQFGSGQPSFRIRGIGTREYSSNNAATVGVYVDEVAHPYTITTQGAMFDISRLEVLRGPQGTLYGRNTTGGAINIITNAPTAASHAGLTAEYGSYDRYKVEGYVSGQVVPGLLGRLAAVTEQGGAWQYSRDTRQKLGDLDKTAIRGRLTWDASQDVTVDLAATYSVDKSDGLGFRLRGPYTVADGSVTYPADTAWRITGWELSPEMAAVSGRALGSKPGRDNNGLDLSARVKADLGWAVLNTVTAYQNFERSEYNDWDGTRFNESDVYFYNDIDAFSQEVRLSSNDGGRLNWMVGAHYADESIDGGFYTQFRGANRTLINTPYEQSVEAIGLFTHNSYALTDRLSLIAGLRYEYEERSLTTSGTRRINVPEGPKITYDTDLSEVTGRLGMEYDLTDNALFYANVARGVKSGGFTTYNATSATPFKPEIVIAYETGVKSDLFDKMLRVNGALFFYDYEDQQVQGLEYDREAGRLGKITNVPKSEIYGGEIELVWTPITGLTISQNFGYKTGEYTEYYAIDGAATDAANPANGPWDVIITNDRSGEPLQFPEFNYGGSIAYDWSMAGLALRAETNYNQRDAIYNAASSSVLPGYWLWNANLSVGPENANWRVGLWGRNLFNTYYEETRNGFNGSARPTTSPNQGRTIGARLTMDF